ncbi:hypothetical protein YB2330_005027 [Saitoella coloradoensis]
MMASKEVLLITRPFSDDLISRLRDAYPELTVHSYPDAAPGHQHSKEIPAEVWRETTILLTLFTFPEPSQAPNLRWIQLYSAGANQIVHHPICTDTSIKITTASGVHGPQIGEWVLMTTLAHYHLFPHSIALKNESRWPEPPERMRMLRTTREVYKRTMGLAGYGSIGRNTARLAAAFGVRVLALTGSGKKSPDTGYVPPGTGDPEGDIPEKWYSADQLNEFLSESDIVVLAVPLTEKTKHMISTKELKAMKPDALLVNVARGDVVDQDALITALKEKTIGGAALDVTQPEPLPSDSELYKLDNVILTPHVSGASNAYDERVVDITVANLRRLKDGKELVNLFSREKGY